MTNQDRREILRALGIMSAAAVFNSSQNRLYAADGSIVTEEGVFDLGDLALECGTVFPNAKVAYKTHGRLNADKSNVILYPTQIGAQHNDIEWLIGPGKALDPERHFVIVLDQLGNGLSSSPSNSPPPFDRGRFPTINIRDDVVAQHRLVTEHFGIRHIALVVGYSMGAQQTYQWAVSHPELVERIAPFCGTAKTPGMKGSAKPALASVKAKATIMASATDLYFTVEDMKSEAAQVPKAKFQVIPSLWGHMAGAGLNAADSGFIECELRSLLAR